VSKLWVRRGSGENKARRAESREYFGKALVCTEAIIAKSPDLDSDAITEIYHLAGESGRRTGRYLQAAKYYEETVTQNPDFKYAAHAQYMIVVCYDQLWDEGLMEKAKAKLQMRESLERIVEKHPNSIGGRTALRWLTNHAISD